MAPKRKAAAKGKQPAITAHALPLLKRPMEIIGKQIDVPGAYWEGSMSAAEKKTKYKCTVRDFELAHAGALCIQGVLIIMNRTALLYSYS